MTQTSTAAGNKALVRRLVDEVINERRTEVIDEISTPSMARSAHAWIEPFLASFSDVRMEVVDLVAEDDKVAARFLCSGSHTGDWRGHPPSRRRFERVDEVTFFQIRDGRIASAWSLEDTADRLRQLGLAHDPS
jgi:predicted ester cyclase